MKMKFELCPTKIKPYLGAVKSERHFLLMSNNYSKNKKIDDKNRLKINLFNYNQFVKIGKKILQNNSKNQIQIMKKQEKQGKQSKQSKQSKHEKNEKNEIEVIQENLKSNSKLQLKSSSKQFGRGGIAELNSRNFNKMRIFSQIHKTHLNNYIRKSYDNKSNKSNDLYNLKDTKEMFDPKHPVNLKDLKELYNLQDIKHSKNVYFNNLRNLNNLNNLNNLHNFHDLNLQNLRVDSKLILKNLGEINSDKQRISNSKSDKQFKTFDLMNNRTSVSSLCSNIISKMNKDKQFILSKEYLNDDSYLPSYDLMKERMQNIIQLQGLNSNYKIDGNNLNEIRIVEKFNDPTVSITPLIIKKI